MTIRPNRPAIVKPSERIRTIRDAKRWDQSGLARAVAEGSGRFQSTSYVCKLEKGVADTAAIDVLDAVADALEVPRAAVSGEAHDPEISDNPVDFVTRQSLEIFATKKSLRPEEAVSLRRTYQTLRRGPRDVSEWITTFAYAAALAQVRKPGARALGRRSTKTSTPQGRRRRRSG
jgi:transcriptional regulator with XRE-family HTH domain